MMTDHDVLVSVSAGGSQGGGGERGGRCREGWWGGGEEAERRERERVSPDGLKAVCIGQVNPQIDVT